uniref:Uncharacterized protein n=1 Tax=Anguilla anguilla TaxID=7936 RepID=A0A0E9VU48_ANGAN
MITSKSPALACRNVHRIPANNLITHPACGA